jgi:succinate dehydrogenase cytochrome b subunit
LLPAEKAQLQFNWYATFLSSIIIIKMIAWLLFASIADHVVYALILTVKNKQANNSQYVYIRTDLRVIDL